jgi:hypothetical protein
LDARSAGSDTALGNSRRLTAVFTIPRTFRGPASPSGRRQGGSPRASSGTLRHDGDATHADRPSLGGRTRYTGPLTHFRTQTAPGRASCMHRQQCSSPRVESVVACPGSVDRHQESFLWRFSGRGRARRSPPSPRRFGTHDLVNETCSPAPSAVPELPIPEHPPAPLFPKPVRSSEDDRALVEGNVAGSEEPRLCRARAARARPRREQAEAPTAVPAVYEMATCLIAPDVSTSTESIRDNPRDDATSRSKARSSLRSKRSGFACLRPAPLVDRHAQHDARPSHRYAP